MTKELLINDLEKDGWDLRIGGYMKNEYCISKHNGIGIFIEEPENDDTFNITCKIWKSPLRVELYDDKQIRFRELPKNYVEYINNIASTMYKKGLIKYNLEKLAQDFV